MNDHEWQQAYNAGRREASKGLAEAVSAFIAYNDMADDGGDDVAMMLQYADALRLARTALAKYREG